MIIEEYKTGIIEILEELGKELDISKSQYKAAVDSYNAVGNYLALEGSSLSKFNPRILPQGSFMLGTIIKPICEDDDIDIDLVCKLERKPVNWTQKHLKDSVGDRLKESDRYKNMLECQEGGKRCWKLEYREESDNPNSKYHMDILPSFSDENLIQLLTESFKYNDSLEEVNKMAIRITDKESDNFETETNVNKWLKSNPFGYARWFFQRAIYKSTKMFSLNESIDPVRGFQKEKMPLQRVVQLLKRHRDIMFSDEKFNSENKPISIIITTLAAEAYDGADNVYDAFTNAILKMRSLITEKYNPTTGNMEKWVANPINEEENFADRWVDVAQKQDYFYLWLDKLEDDLKGVNNSLGRGQNIISESLTKMFGDNVTKKVFSNIADEKRLLRESGKLKMALGTGLLGKEGTKVKNHEFFGNNEKNE